MANKAWNYGCDPANSDRDAVRFLVGDTDKARPLVPDSVIDWSITLKGSIFRAAAMVLRGLAAHFSTLANVTIGEISKNFGDLADKLAARADEMLDEASACSSMSVGGLSLSEKRFLKSDMDRLQPSFEIGGFDNYRFPNERVYDSAHNFPTIP